MILCCTLVGLVLKAKASRHFGACSSCRWHTFDPLTQMVLTWGDLETAERIKGASDELLEDINSKSSLKFTMNIYLKCWWCLMVYT